MRFSRTTKHLPAGPERNLVRASCRTVWLGLVPGPSVFGPGRRPVMAASTLLTGADRSDAALVPPLSRIKRLRRGGGNRPPLLNVRGSHLTAVALSRRR